MTEPSDLPEREVFDESFLLVYNSVTGTHSLLCLHREILRTLRIWKFTRVLKMGLLKRWDSWDLIKAVATTTYETETNNISRTAWNTNRLFENCHKCSEFVHFDDTESFCFCVFFFVIDTRYNEILYDGIKSITREERDLIKKRRNEKWNVLFCQLFWYVRLSCRITRPGGKIYDKSNSGDTNEPFGTCL